MDTFTSFLSTLKDDSNISLIESVQQAYQLIFEASVNEIEPQPWAEEVNQLGDPSEMSQRDRLKFASDSYLIAKTYITKSTTGDLRRILRLAMTPKHKMVIHIKSKSSWIDKVYGRAKNPNTIYDLLRSTIIGADPEDSEKIAKKIKQKANVIDYEYKEKGGDPEFGYYGSYHIAVKLSNGVIAEILIMSRNVSRHKTTAHQYYTKYRSMPSEQKQNTPEYDEDIQASKAIWKLANKQPAKKIKRPRIWKLIDPILKKDYKEQISQAI